MIKESSQILIDSEYVSPKRLVSVKRNFHLRLVSMQETQLLPQQR